MCAQAQTEVKALSDAVKEAMVSSVQDELSAMRQDVADLQRVHYEEVQAAAQGVAGFRTLAPVRTGERHGHAAWSSEPQQDALFPDGTKQAAVESKSSAEDGISELRAQLDRLSKTLPAVQRLQMGDRLHSI